MLPAFGANLDSYFVSISQIKIWKEFVKKIMRSCKKKKKKKEILETQTSQYTNNSDVLKRLFLLGKKRSKLP